jgi:anti-sigma regulatory factor (Ser/Thr protein kinase)
MPDNERLDVAASLHLAAHPQAASRARRFITDFCNAAALPPEVCHTAALLVSELVTNAILHGRTSATMEIHRPADRLRVAVRDDNPVLPPIGNHPDLNAESGRGLTIVSVLADDWGIERLAEGKAVWFELRVPGSP